MRARAGTRSLHRTLNRDDASREREGDERTRKSLERTMYDKAIFFIEGAVRVDIESFRRHFVL